MNQQLINAAAAEAIRLGLEPAILAAVALVESGGLAFAAINGRNEPLIRFEGHYFDRRLEGDARDLARAQGLASPRAGGVRNPASQAARWRLLARAAAIDTQAAHESCSFGVGQVMGAHWHRLGYRDVAALVDDARSGLPGQIRLMTRFIETGGLVPALRRHDWKAFARGYNGPAYAKNAYDQKLAAAFARLSSLPAGPQTPPAPGAPSLKRGDSGPNVGDLQQMLCAKGFPCPLDGAFGDCTELALKAFQARAGLNPDGICGPATLAALQAALPRLSPLALMRQALRTIASYFSKSI